MLSSRSFVFSFRVFVRKLNTKAQPNTHLLYRMEDRGSISTLSVNRISSFVLTQGGICTKDGNISFEGKDHETSNVLSIQREFHNSMIDQSD